MIPAGILSQNTRDLSKEIWISWGEGYSQEEGVHVNVFGVYGTPAVALNNAKNEDSGFYLGQYEFNGGFYEEEASSGTLDIINRRTLIMLKDDDEGIDCYLNLTDSNAPRPIEIYVLRGRTAAVHPLSYAGWSQSGNIPSTASPVQSAMEVTDDWTKIEGLTTDGFLTFQFYPTVISKIRAIVIKLL